METNDKSQPDRPPEAVKQSTKPTKKISRHMENFLIGKSKKMPDNQLPTRMEVLKHFQYLKDIRGTNSELKRIISCPFGDGFR